jgi:hypothetical protein
VPPTLVEPSAPNLRTRQPMRAVTVILACILLASGRVEGATSISLAPSFLLIGGEAGEAVVGCLSHRPIGIDPTSGALSVANSTADGSVTCTQYAFVDASSANPDGLSIELEVVDARSAIVYAVEEEADGTHTIAMSELQNRTITTRRSVPFTVVQLAANVPASRAVATTLLVMTDSLNGAPSVQLIAYDPATSAMTSVLSSSQLTAMNVGEVAIGLSVVNVAYGEIYFIGLSSADARLSNGEYNTTMLHLYSASLTTGSPVVSSDHLLVGVSDIVAIAWSASLSSILLVTSSDVRSVYVPSAMSTAASSIVTVPSANLQTMSISVSYPYSSTRFAPFTYAAFLPLFDSLHSSNPHWLEDESTLLLTVLHSDQSYGLLTMPLQLDDAGSRAGYVGTISATRLDRQAMDELPMHVQGTQRTGWTWANRAISRERGICKLCRPFLNLALSRCLLSLLLLRHGPPAGLCERESCLDGRPRAGHRASERRRVRHAAHPYLARVLGAVGECNGWRTRRAGHRHWRHRHRIRAV